MKEYVRCFLPQRVKFHQNFSEEHESTGHKQIKMLHVWQRTEETTEISAKTDTPLHNINK